MNDHAQAVSDACPLVRMFAGVSPGDPLAFFRHDIQRPSRPEFEAILTGSSTEPAILVSLSASNMRAGHPFKAVLVQPMRLISIELLPEGTLFEGHVTKTVDYSQFKP